MASNSLSRKPSRLGKNEGCLPSVPIQAREARTTASVAHGDVGNSPQQGQQQEQSKSSEVETYLMNLHTSCPQILEACEPFYQSAREANESSKSTPNLLGLPLGTFLLNFQYPYQQSVAAYWQQQQWLLMQHFLFQKTLPTKSPNAESGSRKRKRGAKKAENEEKKKASNTEISVSKVSLRGARKGTPQFLGALTHALGPSNSSSFVLRKNLCRSKRCYQRRLKRSLVKFCNRSYYCACSIERIRVRQQD